MRFLTDKHVLLFLFLYISSIVGAYFLHSYIQAKSLEAVKSEMLNSQQYFDKYSFVLLSSVINSESDPNDPMDMYLVGSTVLNRADNELFPSCIVETVLQKGQYDGINGNFYRTPTSDSIAYRLVMGLGRNRDVLFFYNYRTATDKKFIRLLERKYKLITVTKNHKFYGLK